MAKRKYEPQTKTTEADIPDAELKKPKPITLPVKVQNERDMRRYIRKDGVFRKDFEVQFKGKTKAQAEKIIRDQCKLTGRKVEKELLTDRLKAVPGWDLTIRVPGFAREEQAAPKEPEGETRQKINEALLLKLGKDNERLSAELAKITEENKTVKRIVSKPLVYHTPIPVTMKQELVGIGQTKKVKEAKKKE